MKQHLRAGMASLPLFCHHNGKCLYFLSLTPGLPELNMYLSCNSSNFSLILFVAALYLAEMSCQCSCSDFRRFLYKSSDVVRDVFCFRLEGIFVPSC